LPVIARLRIVDDCKLISYIYSILYTIYESFRAIDANNEQDFSKFLFSPPHAGKEEKCGTPHTLSRVAVLETLLHLTFEKLWNRSQVCDEGDVVGVPNYQFLCHYIISLNRSTGKLSHMNGSVSITGHWDAWRSLSILHDWHSGHILHLAGSKVCGAVRAKCPAQFE
jgi:hypothetical protein